MTAFDKAWGVLKMTAFTDEQVAEMNTMSPEDRWSYKNQITTDRNDKCKGCNKTLNLADLEYGACLECRRGTGEQQ